MRYFSRSIISFAVLSLAPMLACRADESIPSLTIHFDDLNLDSPKGIEALYHRIRNGGKQVCHKADGKGLERVTQHQRCILGAIAGAVHRLNRAELTALYLAHDGDPRLLVLSSLKGADNAVRSQQ
jgi:UrcA family protein